MAKNLAKANGACNAKTVSEGQDFQTPWVIYNPNSTNFKVLYSVHGSLNDQNEFYGDEFDGCGGGGSGSGSGSGGDVYKVTCTYYAEEESGSGSGSGSGSHIKPCKLYYTTNSIESIIVDGVEETLVQYYTFSSTGEHTVEFILKSDSIGDNTFSQCSSLRTCTIGSGVTTIGDFAFYGCDGLESVTISDSVTSIGNSAFYDCSSLTSVTVNAVTPPILGSSMFINTNNCPIYVPCDSVDVYKAATNWSNYSSNIQGIPPCGGGGSGSGNGGE